MNKTKICTNIKTIKAAAKYISENNPNNFSYDHVLDTILGVIENNVNSNVTVVGTMGFVVYFTQEALSVDIDVYVTPDFKAYSGKFKEFDSFKKLERKLTK